MHFPVTLLGIKFGLVGVLPLFHSYLFNKRVVPLSVLQETDTMQACSLLLSTNERNFATEVAGLCYLDDYLKNGE